MGHPADIQETDKRAALTRELRKVLPNLYDQRQVRHSPLIGLFDLTRRPDAPSALQHLLEEAIEALEPGDACPVQSSAWRVFQVLRGRYIDQFSQEEVARDMFLSPRQLRRLEQNAVEVLADHLWVVYRLDERAGLLLQAAPSASRPATTPDEAVLPKDEPSGSNDEISWLERNLSSQVVDCQDFVQSVLQVARPLFESLGAQVSFTVDGAQTALRIHATTVRQAMLHLLTLAVTQAGAGQVTIHAEALPNHLYLRLRLNAQGRSGAQAGLTPADIEGLKVARKLIELSKGTLEVCGQDDPAGTKKDGCTPPVVLEATLTLPTAEQVSVMVIDDNTDTLKLVERYLSGTRYHFLGMVHPSEAIELAAHSTPDVIILDVMLPDMDGWELLGRLRAHPNTHTTPMIVCTILPQAQLALMLGAAEFLSKPIRRDALLSTLDRLVGPAWKESA